MTLDSVLSVMALGGLIFVPLLGSIGVLVFLAAGLLMIARHLTATVNIFLKYWYVLLLPVFCTVSFLWSDYPGLTFRFGLQLSATVAIAIVIAHRLSAHGFIRALFWLLGFAMIASIILPNARGDIGAWLGIYGSKNALAGAAAIFVVLSVGLVLDLKATSRMRLLALGSIAIGMVPLMMAQSVSAMLIVPPAVIVLLGLLFLPGLTKMQRAVGLIFLLLGTVLTGLLIAANLDVIVGKVLDVTGKDLTLTGRTDLWKIALEFIAERPFFGMGYQAFWVKGHAPAESLWYQFGIAARSGFNFHNTYFSNAVEIGILGVGIQVFLLYGALILTGKWALRGQNAEASLLFVLVAMVVIVSFVEVPIFFQFSTRTIIVVCAFVYGARGLADRHRI